MAEISSKLAFLSRFSMSNIGGDLFKTCFFFVEIFYEQHWRRSLQNWLFVEIFYERHWWGSISSKLAFLSRFSMSDIGGDLFKTGFFVEIFYERNWWGSISSKPGKHQNERQMHKTVALSFELKVMIASLKQE